MIEKLVRLFLINFYFTQILAWGTSYFFRRIVIFCDFAHFSFVFYFFIDWWGSGELFFVCYDFKLRIFISLNWELTGFFLSIEKFGNFMFSVIISFIFKFKFLLSYRSLRFVFSLFYFGFIIILFYIFLIFYFIDFIYSLYIHF